MAKPTAKRRHDEADRAFRKAWQLLERIERRLERARVVERKRLAQLGDGSGSDAPRRSAQLEAARAEIAQIEGLLTELSELIAGDSRASSGQTVKDMATSVAAEIKDEAAEPRQLPARGRNRHHRPRRKLASADMAPADTTPAAGSATSDGSAPIAPPPPLEAGSADQPTTTEDAPAVATPTPATRPASVVYRSLISQSSETGPSDRQPGDSGEPGDADRALEEPTSVGDPTPDADRDDPPAEGA
ncbi:MAG: hypothetical protein ACXWWR_07755 [Candidatus Limnocylindrales bacterium]